MTELWSFEHSIECPVPRAFAWQFWTNVDASKLDSDVESVELSGPFAPGSRGVTITRSSGRVEWRIAEVQPEIEAVIEFPGPGATGRFRWTFEDSGSGTRITQRASIGGDAALPGVNAMAVDALTRGLEAGIPAGMRKLCAAMAEAAAPNRPASKPIPA